MLNTSEEVNEWKPQEVQEWKLRSVVNIGNKYEEVKDRKPG